MPATTNRGQIVLQESSGDLITVLFDNSFSWYNPKQIQYKITLSVLKDVEEFDPVQPQAVISDVQHPSLDSDKLALENVEELSTSTDSLFGFLEHAKERLQPTNFSRPRTIESSDDLDAEAFLLLEDTNLFVSHYGHFLESLWSGV